MQERSARALFVPHLHELRFVLGQRLRRLLRIAFLRIHSRRDRQQAAEKPFHGLDKQAVGGVCIITECRPLHIQ